MPALLPAEADLKAGQAFEPAVPAVRFDLSVEVQFAGVVAAVLEAESVGAVELAPEACPMHWAAD